MARKHLQWGGKLGTFLFHICLKPFDSPQVGYLVYEETKKQLLVYNFAENGETIHGVRAQVSTEFFNRSSSIPWTPENSLFGGFRPSCGRQTRSHLMAM